MAESTSSELSVGANVEPTGSDQQIDSFSYNEAIVRLFALATLFWGVIATLVGLVVALLLVMPELATSKLSLIHI